MGALMAKPDRLEVVIPKLEAYHKFFIFLWTLCAIPVVIMTFQMANIGALNAFEGYFKPYENVVINNVTYQVATESAINQWQTCLFQPEYFYTTAANKNDVIAILNTKISEINIALAEIHKGIPYKPEQQGSFTKNGLGGTFINSLVAMGELILGMTLMGQTAVYISWKHPGWLVSAACFGMWCSLLSFSYYTSDPPLPVPSDTNATLLIYLGWLNKFDWINVSHKYRLQLQIH